MFLTSDRAHVEGLGAAIAAGARKVDLPEVVAAAGDYDLVLDGILGIGASADPALRGTARTVVEALLPAVRAGRPRVIAVDLPSGLQPDDGTSDGTVLPASVTVTFGGVKAGLVDGRWSGAVRRRSSSSTSDSDRPSPTDPVGRRHPSPRSLQRLRRRASREKHVNPAAGGPLDAVNRGAHR